MIRLGAGPALFLGLVGCDGYSRLVHRAEPYGVEATLEARVGERVVRQTITDRCRIWSTHDSWETYWHAAGAGRSFDLDLPGGAVLTVASHHRDVCRWTSTPAAGETWSIATSRDDPMGGGEWNVFWNASDAWVRDRRSDPTRLDRYNATLLGFAPEGLRLTALTIRATEPPPPTAPAPRVTQRDFVGVEASMEELRNTTCGLTAPEQGRWVRVDTLDPAEVRGCFPSDNCSSNNPNPCGDELGGLWLDPDPDYARVRLRALLPSQTFLSSYWSAEAVALAGGRLAQIEIDGRQAPTWTPEACIEDACFALTSGRPTLLYDPATRQLVRLSLASVSRPI